MADVGWQQKVWAKPTTARLRFAWGGDRHTRHRWTGRITVEGGKFSKLQSLGLEPDGPGSLWLDEDGLHIAPRWERGFDGCDVTITAEPTAEVVVELRPNPSAKSLISRAKFSQLIHEPFRQALTSPENLLLIHRAPGDALAVHVQRNSLVFDPGESWQLELQPDLGDVQEAVSIEVQLHAVGSEDILWESRHAWSPRGNESPRDEGSAPSAWSHAARPRISLTVPCPEDEGVYRLSISAQPLARFGSRLIGGTAPEVLASRDVEFVVIDPDASVSSLEDHWDSYLSIDPANPKWWERLPTWARWAYLPGITPATLGNVRPMTRPHPAGELMELPPGQPGEEPAWQAYTIPIGQPDEPYLIEVDYPAELSQNLLIQVIEPDAAGRVLTVGRSGGFQRQAAQSYLLEGAKRNESTELSKQRILFWPRTQSPILLIANGHSKLPAQYGQIRLLRQSASKQSNSDTSHDRIREDAPSREERLVAAYLARPTFAENFGAAQILDSGSGLSVESWSTFLEGGRRLTQYLRYCGHNGVLLSVAADGGALYPSQRLAPSPRYDQGVLSASASDPIRKDVLELLLRVADREGVRILPTLQLAGPLPQLERKLKDIRQTGLEWVGHDGLSWLETDSLMSRAPRQGLHTQGTHAQGTEAHGGAPYYNLLNREVQAEVEAIVLELANRYQQHESFAGVAIQLSGNGYAMLPGLAWGFDDQTVSTFSKETGIHVEGIGEERFQHRAKQLLGSHREAWQRWRAQRLASLYQRLGKQLRNQREDLQLILTTEELFANKQAQRQVRLALAGDTTLDRILLDQGIDLEQLGKLDGVTLLCPQRLTNGEALEDQALDLHINHAGVMDQLLESQGSTATLFYHPTKRQRLHSFDSQSPFGGDQTRLSMAYISPTAGAEARRPLVTMLARHDVQATFTGGELLSLGGQESTAALYRTFRQLPLAAAETSNKTATKIKTKTKQPMILRVYRTAETTTVCLINESPWSIQLELSLGCQESTKWMKLGGSPSNSSEPFGPADEAMEGGEGGANENSKDGTRGVMEAGSQQWPISMRPYDLVAWRFKTSALQVEMTQVEVEGAVRQELERRIEAIEVRARNLDIQHSYDQLLNPGFEQAVAKDAMIGWQPRIGAAGKVELDTDTKHTGSQSLHLLSLDAVGVAAQSNLFPMPPTGQLILQVFVHAEQLKAQTRFYIALEDEQNGRTYRQYTTLDKDALKQAEEGWAWFEFGVNDVPFGTKGKMRIQFYLAGPGELWVDDVQLRDLQFAESQRVDMVKQLSAAKRALKEGQWIDCLRLVDDYWPQFLIAHVPPAIPMDLKQAKRSKPPVREAAPQQGLGQKIRGFIPKRWW
jgi:hypothetical protein